LHLDEDTLRLSERDMFGPPLERPAGRRRARIILVVSGDFNATFMSQLIQVDVQVIAARAATDLIHQHPEIDARYRPHAAAKWRLHFESLLKELAASVALESPDLFGRQCGWMAAAFRSRDVPVSDLEAALRVLLFTLERALPRTEHDRLHGYFKAGLSSVPDADDEPAHLNARDSVSRLATELVVAALEGDRRRARDLLVGAVRSGLPLAAAHEFVVLPAMREVGRLWHLGDLSVAEEHVCTAAIESLLPLILDAAPKQPPNGLSVLIASVEGNSHSMALLMLADALEASGFRAVLAGAGVPAPDLVNAVRDFSVDAIALSAVLTTHLEALRDGIRSVRAECDPCPYILVGGLAFNNTTDLWKRVGADGYSPGIWQVASHLSQHFATP
jgi:methanogenic corrinoid protein MtbC1